MAPSSADILAALGRAREGRVKELNAMTSVIEKLLSAIEDVEGTSMATSRRLGDPSPSFTPSSFSLLSPKDRGLSPPLSQSARDLRRTATHSTKISRRLRPPSKLIRPRHAHTPRQLGAGPALCNPVGGLLQLALPSRRLNTKKPGRGPAVVSELEIQVSQAARG